MAISREKKEEIIQKVTDIIKSSASIVFVNFHGLSVSDANALRRELRNKGVGYIVAKKTLVRRALNALKLEGEIPSLGGELALAYLSSVALAKEDGDDMVLPAKSIFELQKKLEGAVTLLGGIVEMRYVDKVEIKVLATIPERKVLYGQFVAAISTPIQQTVGVLNNILNSFVSVLNQVTQSKT